MGFEGYDIPVFPPRNSTPSSASRNQTLIGTVDVRYWCMESPVTSYEENSEGFRGEGESWVAALG